jgi:Zn-dependent protease with chaperone function
LYNLIFVRISHGATRLQEVLADRVAAQTYGARAFQDGLTYVIKRDIEFMKYANSEIEEARKIDRPFNNLYELSGNADRDIEEELKEALNKETSENDTHPSPVDRFRYVDGINTKTFPEDASLVKELFTDWESLTTEMTTQLEERVKQG